MYCRRSAISAEIGAQGPPVSLSLGGADLVRDRSPRIVLKRDRPATPETCSSDNTGARRRRCGPGPSVEPEQSPRGELPGALCLLAALLSRTANAPKRRVGVGDGERSVVWCVFRERWPRRRVCQSLSFEVVRAAFEVALAPSTTGCWSVCRRLLRGRTTPPWSSAGRGVSQLPTLCALCDCLELVSRLTFNLPKCVAVPLWREGGRSRRPWHCEHPASVGGCGVGFLGHLLGPREREGRLRGGLCADALWRPRMHTPSRAELALELPVYPHAMGVFCFSRRGRSWTVPRRWGRCSHMRSTAWCAPPSRRAGHRQRSWCASGRRSSGACGATRGRPGCCRQWEVRDVARRPCCQALGRCSRA